jgi:hypothetical protein
MLGESVARGLRLEPDLARALRAYAVKVAEEHETEVNIAAAARDLLRRALGLCSGAHSCEREGYFRGLAEARRKLATALGDAP